MKQRDLFKVVPAALGIVCCGVRLLQDRTGFEPETGLPIPGAASVVLPVLLAVSALLLLALALRTQPKGLVERPFAQRFDLTRNGALTTALLGAGVMMFSGAWELMEALGGGQDVILSADGMELIARGGGADRAGVFMGALSVAAGACLLAGLLLPRRSEETAPLPLLGVPVCLLARLVFVYRLHSVDPVLAEHYLEILGLAAMILAFYRLSGFAVGAGSLRFWALYTGMTVVLALTMAADGGSAAVLELGGAIALLALRGMARPVDAPPAGTAPADA